MKPAKSKGSQLESARVARVTRASATFPPGLYSTLQELAKRKKVSIAWVIRDAAERYVADEAASLEEQH